MAIEKAPFRTRFDPAAEFVTVRNFLFNGAALPAGQTFDKTKTSVRRLRQLYEGRYLSMTAVSKRKADPSPHPPDYSVQAGSPPSPEPEPERRRLFRFRRTA